MDNSKSSFPEAPTETLSKHIYIIVYRYGKIANNLYWGSVSISVENQIARIGLRTRATVASNPAAE